MDDARREALLREGGAIVLRDDLAVIPLYFNVNTWAMRKSIAYTPRSDSYTLAVDAHPTKSK
jgi:peptide/nickel transport system substrate-binding protein